MNVNAGFPKQRNCVFEGEGLGCGKRGDFFKLGCAPRAFGRQALAGHDGAALSAVSPVGCDFETVFNVGALRKLRAARNDHSAVRLIFLATSRRTIST